MVLGRYKALLFDFDGTLVDSMEAWARVLPQVVEEFGVATEEEIERIVEAGNNGYDPIKTVLPHLEESVVREIYSEARKRMLENLELLRPIFSREELLAILKGRPALVVSNSHSAFIRSVLEYFHLDVFDDYIGPDLTGVTKPHPFHLEYALDLVGEGRIAFVGDSRADEEVSHAVGIDFYHVRAVIAYVRGYTIRP